MDQNSTTVHVPAPWSDKRVVLKPAADQTWSGAEVAGEPLETDFSASGWLASPALAFGHWNTVTARDGATEGARLVASEPLHITSLEASVASERSLSVRIQLSVEGLVDLFFTLTAPDGRQVGSLEVTVSRKASDLTVEMPLVQPLDVGPYRLKASLMVGERVVDNARIVLSV